MVWKQQFDNHIPSLGYDLIDWIEEYEVHGPGDVQGTDIEYDDEIRRFIIETYRIDPITGRRVYSESVLSRPKGRAKSEVAGHIGVAEALGPCRFDGWDANGQPVARPVVSPLLKCLASEESQAGNTFENIAFICSQWGPDVFPKIYGGITGARQYQSATALYLPKGGEIRACSSGAASKDGGKETWVCADETHLYVTNELRNMYSTIARNLGSKRKASQPHLMQTSTAYRPGEMSVFEETLTLWRKGELPGSVLMDHREAKGAIRIRDREHTMKQLQYVYGAASEWQDMDRKYADMIDPRICPDDATAARYYLNRPMATKDAWIPVDVHERQTQLSVVEMGESICLGFDGSLNDDTTVLRGSRMSDGYLFRIGAWPKPEGAAGVGWEVPRLEVLAAFREAFTRYDVVRAYCDPHEWRSDIDTLAAEFGEKRVVSWETRRDTAMAYALDRLHADLVNGQVWHDDDPLAAEHYGNAYLRLRGQLRLVRKENPGSSRKIDTVVADALAFEARADAFADGWGQKQSKFTRVKGRVSTY